ncbi:Uncharacterized protein YvpB [Bacillus sp. OV166]|uniref:C39 family peptidase n=1 Tax=Bacillus sp. OV166 TaxID=1882763 RepID=UPI000A2ABE86|nr:C39 family peptidase [Bacillus sp. OV166]SMQ84339.1 Uncharacterized protein YvpB [Bacillus sp. OV166]
MNKKLYLSFLILVLIFPSLGGNVHADTVKKSTKIEVFYPNSNVNTSKKIRYIFNINSGGYIVNAVRLDEKTQKVTNQYVYYPNTVYGKHANNIRYIFNIDAYGKLTKAVLREKGTQRILSRYEYYPGTVYGAHAKNIKYIFTINTMGYVTQATQREKGTQRILSWYQYNAKTVYGNHATKVSSLKLNVPLINQRPELPTGCEITAVTMMLQYKGVRVDKVTLAKKMPRHSSNPNLGYVGNPFTKSGWTIYPPALMGLVKNYAGSAKNLTGASNGTIEKQLVNNKPVVVLVSRMHGFSVHALVLTGFDQSNYYYNDCWTGEKNAKISKAEFNRLWGNQSKRAISY